MSLLPYQEGSNLKHNQFFMQISLKKKKKTPKNHYFLKSNLNSKYNFFSELISE